MNELNRDKLNIIKVRLIIQKRNKIIINKIFQIFIKLLNKRKLKKSILIKLIKKKEYMYEIQTLCIWKTKIKKNKRIQKLSDRCGLLS